MSVSFSALEYVTFAKLNSAFSEERDARIAADAAETAARIAAIAVSIIPGLSTTSADNGPAIAAAVAAKSAAGGGTLMIPPGVYNIATPIPMLPRVSIQGAGGGATVLRGTAASMVMFSWSAISAVESFRTYRDLVFDGAAAGITAIHEVFSWGTTVTECRFQGIAQTVILDRCWYGKVINNRCRGNASFRSGQLLITNTGTDYSKSFNHIISGYINDCSETFGMSGSQVTPLIKVRNTEGSVIVDCTGNNLDTQAPNSLGHLEISGVCQGINVSRVNSIGAATGIAVLGDAIAANAPSYVDIEGCEIDSFYTAGIEVIGQTAGQMNLITVRGGVITAPKTDAVPGVLFFNAGSGCSAHGVMFQQWLGLPVKSGKGVALENSTDVTVSGCKFLELTTPITITGTGTKHLITGNSVVNCTNDIIGGGAGAGQAGNKIIHNQFQFVPSGIEAGRVARPASGVPWFNDTGYDLTVYITGGTVTAIAINGAVTGLTAGSFFLPAGGSTVLTMVYSASPGWSAVATA